MINYRIIILILFYLINSFADEPCNSCNYDKNDFTSKYCEQCGESLLPKTICSSCKYENTITDEYCLNCTNELEGALKEEPPVINKQKSFSVPRPTIITTQQFRNHKIWGKHDTGKITSYNGKRFSNHYIYYKDTFYFIQQIKRGIKKIKTSSNKSY
ncbi:hypothetical protein BVX93_01660 [bacterium B13(2017)]|nr:hypothetical protein BVX93_01660 [bacterium B13(2017)]